ncbi:ABC transporter ATP-binding protein [Wenzhouxiangella sp. EGI_FJ10305]|uniref:ABC transporter ATP-binding protein n=1 Tax=Wenzhouxiangella sp. EGI_FJ10305 TaxID=3243768 RepID=UPI0035D6EBC1
MQFLGLFVLMLVGAGAELVTIGAVIPFISLMSEPEAAFQYPLLQDIFSALGWRRPEAIVFPMAIAFVALVAAATSIRLLLLWVSTRLVFALGYDIGVSLYNRVLSQPYSYHISHNTSAIIAAVNKVQAVINGAVRPVMEGAIALILSLAIIGALVAIDPGATLGAAITFVIFYWIIATAVRVRLRANGKRIAAAQTDRVRCVQEGLGGIRDVILDQSQRHYTSAFARTDQSLRQAQARNNFLNQAPRYIVEAIGVFLIVSLALVLSGQTGGLVEALPILGALALGAQRLLPLLQRIYGAWSRMTGNHQMFADVLSMLQLPRNTLLPRHKIIAQPFEKEIRLESVGFQYDTSGEEVLKDIDVTISNGARVGIIGPTGSGKSTLADIIMGLLEPTQGQLTVDGVPIDSSNRSAWQKRISHVPQHIYLADASIAENIAIGVPESRIDRDRITWAARCARIADFIESSPAGYDARVGERGIQLSGGQRQRIGIARALYRDADVLIFDEASSALDSDTESAVMDAINGLSPDLTMVLIAHRVATLKDCNLVIRLDSGQILERGNHSAAAT